MGSSVGLVEWWGSGEQRKGWTYGSVAGFKTVELLLGLGELLFWHLRLQDFLNHLPECLMLFLQEHD